VLRRTPAPVTRSMSMFAKLFKSRRPAAAPLPEVPAGKRIYAVGDIHGRLDLLERLIGMIDDDDAARGSADTTLLFLGDLVDRGPDSAGVVARLLELSRSRPSTRFLMGNHEEVFLLAASGDVPALKFFCRIGGRETILSYGIGEAEYNAMDFEELDAELRARVPDIHLDFMSGFENSIAIGDYLFVHAGLRPGVPLAEQKTKDLRWIRDPFLTHADPFEGFVVHGHTITDEVDERTNRIGIDTGAYFSGTLTALGLEGSERWLLQTSD
jgi:serine/threonine protein phosphatase 1